MKAKVPLPLVSVGVMTYNQERYVKEAITSILNQEYDNMEIVISDDCSNDGTWMIVEDAISAYRGSCGSHKIIANRNSKNIGISKNFQKLISMCSGQLIVCCGGDDISYSNRVSRIVEEWVKCNCEATVIHHGYREISETGKHLSCRPPRSAACALGATAAYAARVFRFFPPPEDSVTIEDQVWAKRALLLGNEIQMPDILLDYRKNVGVSTNFKDDRERLYKSASTMAASCRQIIKDIDLYVGQLDSERCKHVGNMVNCLYADSNEDAVMASSASYIKRFQGVMSKIKRGRLGISPIRIYFGALTFLLPWRIGAIQRNLYMRFVSAIKHRFSVKGSQWK